MAATSAPETHDPGGLTFAMPAGMSGTAIFGGTNDNYRYLLSRQWSLTGLTALWVMMNPSAADPMRDDRTIQGICRKTMQWDRRGIPHAFGRLLVCNTFAFRAKDQSRLATDTVDPIGPENDAHILAAAAEADLIIIAYGLPNAHRLRSRGPQVARMLEAAGHSLHVLRLTKDGVPGHPLYVPDSAQPMPWRAPAA